MPAIRSNKGQVKLISLCDIAFNLLPPEDDRLSSKLSRLSRVKSIDWLGKRPCLDPDRLKFSRRV